MLRYRTVDRYLPLGTPWDVPRRSPTVWDELVRRSDIRHAFRVVVFMEAWYTAVREWDAEPTAEQFGEAWDLRRGQVSYQVNEFRRLLPSESSPTRICRLIDEEAGEVSLWAFRQVPWKYVLSE